MGAKTKEVLENTETFSFLGVWKKKEKKKRSKSQTGTHPAKGSGFITQAFFLLRSFFKSCSPCASISSKVEMLFPELYWYMQMLGTKSFPLSDANCENCEESYFGGISGSPGAFVIQPKSFCKIEIVFPFLGPTWHCCHSPHLLGKVLPPLCPMSLMFLQLKS